MRLSFDRLWVVVAITLPAFVALLVPVPAVDLAYQVRAGNQILATGTLPAVDTWTFTIAGTPWVDQQWFSQVLLAMGYNAGGWELLVVVRAALIALAVGLLVAVGVVRGASTRTASILALAAFGLTASAMALRPQLLGIVLFTILLLLVAARERHPRAFLLAPLVIMLWANVHGSFVMGPLLLGYAWAEDLLVGRPRAARSLLVFLAGTLATLVNPYGAGVWAYAVGIGGNPGVTQMVTEWQRTSLFRMPGAMLYPAAIAALVLLVRGRSRVSLPAWGLALVLTLMALWAERGVAWWALGMVYLLAGVLPAGLARSEGAAIPAEAQISTAEPGLNDAYLRQVRSRRAGRLNAAIAAVLVVLVIVALPWWRPSDPLTGRVGLVSYAPSGLAQELRGMVGTGTRVFVPQNWGSWFEWAVPEALYYVDSRFELFTPDIWADYLAYIDGQGADVLDLRGVDVAVVPATWTPPQGWVKAYGDVDGGIYVRGDAP
jgi:hypothetical protein